MSDLTNIFQYHVDNIERCATPEHKTRYFIRSVPNDIALEVAEYFRNGMWLAIVINFDPRYDYINTTDKREAENFHTIGSLVDDYLWGNH